MNSLSEGYLDRRQGDSSFNLCAFQLVDGSPQNQFTSGSSLDQTQAINRGKSPPKSDVTDDVDEHKTHEEATTRLFSSDGDVTSPMAGSLADHFILREAPSCAQSPSRFEDSATNESNNEQSASAATSALAETAGHVRDPDFMERSVGSRTPELASAKLLDLTPLQEQLRACIAASYLGPEEEDFDTGYDFPSDADMNRFGFCSALSDVPSFFQSELI